MKPTSGLNKPELCAVRSQGPGALPLQGPSMGSPLRVGKKSKKDVKFLDATKHHYNVVPPFFSWCVLRAVCLTVRPSFHWQIHPFPRLFHAFSPILLERSFGAPHALCIRPCFLKSFFLTFGDSKSQCSFLDPLVTSCSSGNPPIHKKLAKGFLE